MALITKADLTTHIYPEITDLITRSDDSLLDKAIAMGEGEAKSYLNRYDLTTLFGGTFTDEFLKGIVKDIISWHIIKLANPNINMELFRTSYEDAIRFLEKVMKGLTDPGWPLRPDDPTTPIDDAGNVEYRTNPKRRNSF